MASDTSTLSYTSAGPPAPPPIHGDVTHNNCTQFCAIEDPQWCDNLFVGLSVPNFCTNEQCVDVLCSVALRCQKELRAEQAAAAAASHSDAKEDVAYCPKYFDGWSCINATRAGELAEFACPPFDHLNYDAQNMAYSECSPEGEWFDSALGKPYTHYSQCPDVAGFQTSDTINKIYVAGYSVSIVFLAVATFIFIHFRSLRCVRNTIHTNLFVALMFNSVAWIVWYHGVVYRMSDWEGSDLTVVCRALNIIVNYFMVCTYFWVLCEGMYLLLILVKTFISERRVIIAFSVLGWGVPAALVLSYALLRALSAEEEHQIYCWMSDVSYNWIYKIPCIGSVIANFFFLVAIVLILVSKLHTDVSDRAAMVKTTKAIGVLVPLFGLHNILAAFKPDAEESKIRIAIEVYSALSISFQGMIVAILFCLINNEVIFQVKKFFADRTGVGQQGGRHPSLALTQYTHVRHSPSPQPPHRASFNDANGETEKRSTTFV